MNAIPKFLPADFASDQEVRWCPGCGDYSILKAVQRTLSQIGAKPENTVCVSGIGCSSRFPYYLETYGFHTIHGRAPAIATGVKLANPALDVWIVTGDGDALSIGGNHMLHLLRRNLDCQVLLFNNEIYGLTKGQCSPTSRVGTRSPSTPFGSVERPINPCGFALGAGARFVARVVRYRAEQAARRSQARARTPGQRASSRSIRTASSTMMARSKSSPARRRLRTRCSGSRRASRCCSPTARRACGSTANA